MGNAWRPVMQCGVIYPSYKKTVTSSGKSCSYSEQVPPGYNLCLIHTNHLTETKGIEVDSNLIKQNVTNTYTKSKAALTYLCIHLWIP